MVATWDGCRSEHGLGHTIVRAIVPQRSGYLAFLGHVPPLDQLNVWVGLLRCPFGIHFHKCGRGITTPWVGACFQVAKQAGDTAYR